LAEVDVEKLLIAGGSAAAGAVAGALAGYFGRPAIDEAKVPPEHRAVLPSITKTWEEVVTPLAPRFLALYMWAPPEYAPVPMSLWAYVYEVDGREDVEALVCVWGVVAGVCSVEVARMGWAKLDIDVAGKRFTFPEVTALERVEPGYVNVHVPVG